jgi:hypothetical protein
MLFGTEITSGKPMIFQRNDDTGDLVKGITDICNGEWHHLVYVSDGTSYRIYVDGVAESLTVSSGGNFGDWFADTSVRDNLTVGARTTTSTLYYTNGSLSDIAVYNYPLTPDEVKAHYNIGVWSELPYSVYGIVYDDTASPCSRIVRLYNRNTGELISQTISDPTTGEYTFALSTQDELQRIVLDDESGTFYNDLIDRVIPG